MPLYFGAPEPDSSLDCAAWTRYLNCSQPLRSGLSSSPAALWCERSCLSSSPSAGRQLLVDLVAPDLREVVALRVEEQVLQEGLRALRRGRLARAQLAVDVLEGLFLGLDVVLLQRELDGRRVLEQLQDLVLGPAERLQQDGDVLPALAVDPDADGVLLVDVELQPGAAPRDDLRDVDVLVGGLVQLTAEVDARRTHQLRDDHALGPVDDEGAVVGHHGEIAHEDLLLLDLPGDLVDEGCFDEQGPRERDVLVAALLLGELLRTEFVRAEVELELFGEVLDRADLFENLFDPLVQEPEERLLLYGYEVRKGENLVELGETDTVAGRHRLVRQAVSLPGNSGCARRMSAMIDGTANEQCTQMKKTRQPRRRGAPANAGGTVRLRGLLVNPPK